MRTEFERAYYVAGQTEWEPDEKASSSIEDGEDSFYLAYKGYVHQAEEDCVKLANLAIARMIKT